MTYSFSCGDVMPGCAASFEAPSAEELLAQVGDHAGAAHGLTEVTPDVLRQVKANITGA